MAFACALLSTVALLASAQLVTVPWPTPSSKPLNITMGYGTVNSTGTRFNWYVAVLDDFSRFSVVLPQGGCSVRGTTTSTAALWGCEVAINAGFFSFTASPTYCRGELVVNSTVVNWDGDGDGMVSVTRDNTTLVGALTKEQVKSLGVTFGVNGFGVIVRDGRVDTAGVAAAKARLRAARPTAEEVAPRTVAGLDAQGRLLLVTIDGVEGLLLGVTMDEIAEVMAGGAAGVPFKALHAVNLDGGGSTTMSASPAWPLPAAIYNRPTNTDVGPVSERNVTSVMCVAGPPAA